MDNGQLFEIIMLVCFGFSWPITIYKTIKSKTVKGITPVFYILVLVGYVSGIIYKIFYNYNYSIWFYVMNAVFVSAQIVLFYYFHNLESKKKD